MNVRAEWTGCGYTLCIGEWKLYVDGEDVTDKIPEELRTEPMNTYKQYERWSFNHSYIEEWESYCGGLEQEEWIESNRYWLDKITTDVAVQRQIFKAINEKDFRTCSCGGCI